MISSTGLSCKHALLGAQLRLFDVDLPAKPPGSVLKLNTVRNDDTEIVDSDH